MATINDPMPSRMSQVDDLTRGDHAFLGAADEVYFWGEYHVGKGYKHGPTNSLISNLKKSPTLRGTSQYPHKENAIRRIGQAFCHTIKASQGPFTVVPVPPSKVPGEPEYDDRMLQIAGLAVAGTTSVARELVRQTASYEASHLAGGGHRIRPEELMAFYEIGANEAAPHDVILVIDDVLTAGAHFRAMKDTIRQRFPGKRVIGLMAARAVHDAAQDFDVL